MAYTYSREQATSYSALNPTKSSKSPTTTTKETVATKERRSSSDRRKTKEQAAIADAATEQGASDEVVRAIWNDQYSVDKDSGEVTVNYTEKQALRSQAPRSTDAPPTQSTRTSKDDSIYPFNPKDTITNEVRDEQGRVIGYDDTMNRQSVLAPKGQYYSDETIRQEEERRQKQFTVNAKLGEINRMYDKREADVKDKYAPYILKNNLGGTATNIATFGIAGIVSDKAMERQSAELAPINRDRVRSQTSYLTGDTVAQQTKKIQSGLFEQPDSPSSELKGSFYQPNKQSKQPSLRKELLNPPININIKVDQDRLDEIKSRIDDKGGFFKDGKIYKPKGLKLQ